MPDHEPTLQEIMDDDALMQQERRLHYLCAALPADFTKHGRPRSPRVAEKPAPQR